MDPAAGAGGPEQPALQIRQGSTDFSGVMSNLLRLLAPGAALAGLLLCGCAAVLPSEAGRVNGTLRILDAARLPRGLGHAAVYLEQPSGGAGALAGWRRIWRDFGWGASRVEIATDGALFSDRLWVASPGDRLVFVNRGRLSHRIFASAAQDLVREVQPGGHSLPLAMTRRGSQRFYCSLHPDENFLVLVVPHEVAAVIDPEGRFELRGVDPGSYRLHFWSELHAGFVREIDVRRGSSRESVILDAALIP